MTPQHPTSDRACDVSIIVVNYNARAFLLDCLRTIYRETTTLTYEILVIDNASRDGSATAVADEFPDVTLIANRENRGFAAANNQGLRIARGRYVLLLNPDTLILDRAIERMVAFADARPEIGCAGCQVLLDSDTLQMTCFRFPSPLNLLLSLSGLSRAFPTSRLFGRYFLGWWDRKSERAVDVVSGMFMLVRRQALDAVGLMDEDYFVYAEEADWCYRFWQHGWQCVFTPTARIVHCEGGGKSTRLVSTRMYVQLQKSILIFHRKNLGRASWLAARLIFSAAMLARWTCLSLAAALSASDRLQQTARQAAAATRFHWLGLEPTA